MHNMPPNIWTSWLDPQWLACLEDAPLLRACGNGTIPLKELNAFTVQHYHYARHFTRFLCGLIANLDEEGDRAMLTENLFEEMGLGEGGGVPHSQLFRNMLEGLGLDPAKDPVLPATQRLIDGMRSRVDAGPWSGLGALCLGAEAIVPRLYSKIVQGYAANGIEGDVLAFYHVHIVGSPGTELEFAL